MLDECFLEQMKEIVKSCARTRQTLLFSATMTDQVNQLATVSLNKPVKVFVDSNKVSGLQFSGNTVHVNWSARGSWERGGGRNNRYIGDDKNKQIFQEYKKSKKKNSPPLFDKEHK